MSALHTIGFDSIFLANEEQLSRHPLLLEGHLEIDYNCCEREPEVFVGAREQLKGSLKPLRSTSGPREQSKLLPLEEGEPS